MEQKLCRENPAIEKLLSQIEKKVAILKSKTAKLSILAKALKDDINQLKGLS